MLTAKQLEERKSGVGSSEIAAIVGLSPWADAVDVYNRKLDLVTPRSSNAMTAGLWLEDSVAAWAADREGWTLRRCNRTLRHRTNRWMLATPDRFRMEMRSKRRTRAGLVEVKTTISTDGWGADGTDEIPDYYRCQGQWQMLVTGLKVVHYPVFFFRSREMRIYRVDHSDELAEALIGAGAEVWHDHVLLKEVPELDPRAESTGAYMAAVLKQEGELVVQAPSEAAKWAEQLLAARHHKSMVEGLETEAENYLKAYVGEHRGIQAPWGRFLWYTTKGGGTDWKALAADLLLGMSEKAQQEHIKKHARPGGRRVRFTPRKEDANVE